MPPGRPPKRTRPSHPQSALSPVGPPQASPNVTTEPNHSVDSSPSNQSTSFVSTGDSGDSHHLTPFLNTTFSTHRLSPLHVGTYPLTQDRIHTLSLRLRDFLVGDVVRGVEVGLAVDRPFDDGAMSRTGALEAVAIAWVTLDGLLGPFPNSHQHRVGQDSDPMQPERSLSHEQAQSELKTSAGAPVPPPNTRALQISLQYEHAECAALLLPSTKDAATSHTVPHPAPKAPEPLLDFGVSKPDEEDPAFLHLPLLLLRMPAPLKASIITFLTRTFDCRVSPLNLGTRSLVRALETWTSGLGPRDNVNSAKDIVLTLGFHPPAVTNCSRPRHQHQQVGGHTDQMGWQEEHRPETSDIALGLKSIDVIIPFADHLRFIAAAKARNVGDDVTQRQVLDKRKTPSSGSMDRHTKAKRRKLGGDKDEEGWTWRRWPAIAVHSGSMSESGPPQPFIESLALYLQQHLALDMFHPAVRVSKIACGGFVLSEGRVKMFGTSPSGYADNGVSNAKQRAAWDVLGVLLEKARPHPPDGGAAW